MEYEWDETKRVRTLQERGLDFIDAILVLGADHLIGTARTVGGEERFLAVGKIADVYVTLIFTLRGESRRIISMRRARRDEERRYQEIFGR